jgi:HK97 family phage prohead protease
MIQLVPSQITVDAAAADGLPRRSISGVAVTYDETATVSDGTRVRFLQGSLPVTGRDPKLFGQHDSNQIIGKLVDRVDTAEGMMFTAKISATRLGDEYLTLANDGVIDAVSVGVNPIKFSYDDDGTMIIESAEWTELSLVSQGAFSGAIIEHVAASKPADESIHETPTEPAIQSDQDTTKETDMTDKIEAPVVEAAQSTVDKLWAQPKQEFKMPTPGEYMAAMHIGGDTFRKVQEACKAAAAKNQTALQAAAGDIVTTDTPGLLPVPVLGPLFQDLNFVRPVVTAFGARAMPNTPSKTFIRPTITTHTSAATQSSELAAVSATTMVIASNVVTKSTVAGQVTLSVQDMDFTDPAAMNLILNDLAGEYLIATDNIAADNLVTGATASGSTWTVNSTDPTSLIASIYDAAREIAEDSNYFPTHICVSPNIWELLGRQLDGDKRPLLGYNGGGMTTFNGVGNTSGLQYSSQNIYGLNMVVDNNFANNTMLVVYAPGYEIYEQQKGVMSVEVPATLGRTFSYYGYFATFVAKSSFIQSIAIA